MKPRKPDPLPRIRIQLSPTDALDPIDLGHITGGNSNAKPANESGAAPAQEVKPLPSGEQPGLDGTRA